jgi:hypothetical protein
MSGMPSKRGEVVEEATVLEDVKVSIYGDGAVQLKPGAAGGARYAVRRWGGGSAPRRRVFPSRRRTSALVSP